MEVQKMGRANLSYQLKSAIGDSFVEGYDKRSSKYDADSKPNVVASYSYKDSLCSTASMFAKYLNEYHPDVDQAKDVEASMCNGFLNLKAKTCSTATLGKYASHLYKTQYCVNEKYASCNVEWRGNLIIPVSQKTPNDETLRTSKGFDRDDYDRCVDFARGHNNPNVANAFELSGRFGLRIEGCAKITAGMVNLDVSGRYGHGHIELYREDGKGIEKGGRPRIIDIRTSADASFIKSLCDSKAPSDRLIGLSASRIDGALYETKVSLGIQEKYKYTGIHAFRKMWAQDLWDKNKAEGMEKRDNISYCNNQLGHGDNRGERGIRPYINMG